jgi:hypothetical protein
MEKNGDRNPETRTKMQLERHKAENEDEDEETAGNQDERIDE